MVGTPEMDRQLQIARKLAVTIFQAYEQPNAGDTVPITFDGRVTNVQWTDDGKFILENMTFQHSDGSGITYNLTDLKMIFKTAFDILDKGMERTEVFADRLNDPKFHYLAVNSNQEEWNQIQSYLEKMMSDVRARHLQENLAAATDEYPHLVDLAKDTSQ